MSGKRVGMLVRATVYNIKEIKGFEVNVLP